MVHLVLEDTLVPLDLLDILALLDPKDIMEKPVPQVPLVCLDNPVLLDQKDTPDILEHLVHLVL